MSSNSFLKRILSLFIGVKIVVANVPHKFFVKILWRRQLFSIAFLIFVAQTIKLEKTDAI